MPAGASGLSDIVGLGLAGLGPLDQANVAVCGSAATEKRPMPGMSVGGMCTAPPSCLSRGGGRIDVIDGDIAEPARLRAGSPRLLRQYHQSADGGLAESEQRVGHAGRRGVTRRQADDLGVEGRAAATSVVINSYQTKCPCESVMPAYTPVLRRANTTRREFFAAPARPGRQTARPSAASLRA